MNDEGHIEVEVLTPCETECIPHPTKFWGEAYQNEAGDWRVRSIPGCIVCGVAMRGKEDYSL